MATNLKKIICVVLVVLMCMTAAPLGGFVGIDFGFGANALSSTGEASVTLCDGISYTFDADTGVLTISGTGDITDFAYTTSGTRSPFLSDTEIKTVIIEEGITKIGNYLFYNCGNISSVSLPDSLDSIGQCAFYGCANLTSITVPDGVTKIGNEAFKFCSLLATVTIGEKVESIGNEAFSNCAITSIVLPDSVKTLGNKAFTLCGNLETVSIGKGLEAWDNLILSNSYKVKSITVSSDNNNFSSADGVLFNKDKTKLVYYPWAKYDIEYKIPSTVTTLGINLFPTSSCKFLYIPKSVISVEENAFEGFYQCTIYYAGTQDEFDAISIASGNDYLKNNVKCNMPFGQIGDDVWYLLNAETNELTISGTGAMWDFDASENPSPFVGKSFAKIEIQNGVTGVGKDAFNGTVKIESLYSSFPDSLTKVGDGAFKGVAGFTSVYLPSNVTEIGKEAFYCPDLDSVAFNGKVSTIGSAAFVGLTKGLVSVAMAGDATYFCVEKDVLYNSAKTRLVVYAGQKTDTSFSIPEAVTEIDAYAFNMASKLETLDIPASVTSIGLNAFCGCSALTQINFGGTQSEWDALVAKRESNDDLADVNINFAIVSGKIGENAFYEINSKTGIATITGSGDTYNFDGTESNKSPFAARASSVKTITIADTITSIGDYLFTGCAFESVDLPTSLTKIGKSAFENTSLKAVSISATVTQIGNKAFANCTNLEKFTVDALNTAYCSEDGILFNKNKTTLIEFPAAKKEVGQYAYAVPETVTAIGDYAFASVSKYNMLQIPTSVTSIGAGAFNNSTIAYIGYLGSIAQWENITLGEDNGHLDSVSFVYGIATVKIGDNVYCEIDKSTKEAKITGTGTTYSNYGSSETVSPLSDYLSSIEKVTVGEGITTLGANLFANLNVKSVTLPSTLTKIGYRAFYNCGKLTSIDIPARVTDIEQDAFYNCTSLVTVTLHEGLKNVHEDAFACCAVKSITIPDSVTMLDGYVFCYSALETIAIGKGLEEASNYTFDKCENLKTITVDADNAYFVAVDNVLFDKDMKVIYCYAAQKSETEYTIPDSVRTVYADFYGVANLEVLHIPYTVTSLDADFSECTALTDIYYGGTESMWNELCGDELENVTVHFSDISLGELGDFVFYTFDSDTGTVNIFGSGYMNDFDESDPSPFFGDTTIKAVVFESGIKYIGDYAFASCTSLESVTFPDTLEKIGYYSFENCTSLESVTFPDCLKRIYEGAFMGSGLKSVEIPKNVYNIEEGVFAYCSSLTTITVHADNEYYYAEDNVLFNVEDEELVCYPAGKTDTEYTIASTISSLEKYAFAGATKLVKITVPESVDYLPRYVFAGCTALEKIMLPVALYRIRSNAFKGNTSLTSVFYNGTAEQWAEIRIGESNNTALTNATMYYSHTEHEWDNGKVTTNATHLKEGVMTYTCPCGETKTEPISKLTDHEWDNGKVTTNATHLKEGVKTYTCACGETKTEPVAKTAEHSYVDNVVAPSCTEKGYTEHICACGDKYVDSYVDASGHHYENGTCTECGDVDPDYNGGDNDNDNSDCDCICHNSNKFVQFIYKIVRWFWKLFNIRKTCDCGVVHY